MSEPGQRWGSHQPIVRSQYSRRVDRSETIVAYRSNASLLVSRYSHPLSSHQNWFAFGVRCRVNFFVQDAVVKAGVYDTCTQVNRVRATTHFIGNIDYVVQRFSDVCCKVMDVRYSISNYGTGSFSKHRDSKESFTPVVPCAHNPSAEYQPQTSDTSTLDRQCDPRHA